MKARDYSKPYRVTNGKKFRLDDVDPAETRWVKNEAKAADLLKEGVKVLSDLQEKLYAQDRWALLLIFQAMDAAGKDGAIKHVMSGVNPQGCQVYSFKAPSHEELDHDFLWRMHEALPERGRIGIFNRSYYEEVLVVRVHRSSSKAEAARRRWSRRTSGTSAYEDINALRALPARNGIVIRKFFLHVSKEEQQQRFLERLDEPEKNWKFSVADVRARALGRLHAGLRGHDPPHRHRRTRRGTSCPPTTSGSRASSSPRPSSTRWIDMNLEYPKVDGAKKRELADARRLLLAEKKTDERIVEGARVVKKISYVVCSIVAVLGIAGVCHAQPPGITPEMIAGRCLSKARRSRSRAPTRSRPSPRSARPGISCFVPTISRRSRRRTRCP